MNKEQFISQPGWETQFAYTYIKSLIKGRIMAVGEQTMDDLRRGLATAEGGDTDLNEYVRDDLGLAKTATLLEIMAFADPKPCFTTTPRNNMLIIKPIIDDTNRHIMEMKMGDKTSGKKRRGGGGGRGGNRGGFGSRSAAPRSTPQYGNRGGYNNSSTRSSYTPSYTAPAPSPWRKAELSSNLAPRPSGLSGSYNQDHKKSPQRSAVSNKYVAGGSGMFDPRSNGVKAPPPPTQPPQNNRLPRTSPYSMQTPKPEPPATQWRQSAYSQSMPPPSEASSESIRLTKQVETMSIAAEKPTPSSPVMSKDERIRVVKDMIKEEANGITVKNLYHRYVYKYPEQRGKENNFSYLSSFENFVMMHKNALSCEIDSEGIVRGLRYSAEHFMNIFEKARSKLASENKAMTVGDMRRALAEHNVSWQNYGYHTIYQLMQSRDVHLAVNVDLDKSEWDNYVLERVPMDRKKWDEQVARAVQLYWFVENAGGTLTCVNYRENYKKYFNMDVPLEVCGQRATMDTFFGSIVEAQYHTAKNPLFITDDGHVKVKPNMRKSLFESYGISQDKSFKMRIESRFKPHAFRNPNDDKKPLNILLAGEFYDVDNFYVHTKQDYTDLEKINEQMTCLYKSDQSYNQLNCRPVIGSAVAAFDVDSNQWLRAEVIEVADGEHVSIEFVDYGTTSDQVSIRPSEIRWLDAKFLQHPKKCIKVGLYGVSASTATRQDELDNSASQIFYKWGDNVDSQIYMDIIAQRKSMNGSLGVRIRKEERGQPKVYFEQFLAKLDCCKLTDHHLSVAHQSDSCTSSSSSESGENNDDNEPDAHEHEGVGMSIHQPLLHGKNMFMTYVVFDDLSVFLPLDMVHHLLDLELKDRVKPIDKLKIKKYLKTFPVHTLLPGDQIIGKQNVHSLTDQYDLAEEMIDEIIQVRDKRIDNKQQVEDYVHFDDIKKWRTTTLTKGKTPKFEKMLTNISDYIE